MSYNPLPHSPLGAVPGTAAASSMNPMDHPLADPSISAQTTTLPGLAQPSQKRGPSKGKVPQEIRRSSSTPHMRNLPALNNPSGELSPTGDKRRNKLGYHRTSVACGHCRRRKIRCLVAPDDQQGRCSNCIRLKKECCFFPVEQNPEPRPHLGTAKDTGSGTSAVSGPSSGSHGPPSTSEKSEEYRASGLAPYGGASRLPLQADVDVVPAQIPHSGAIQYPSYSYPQPTGVAWSNPGFLPSSTVVDNSSPSSATWKPSPVSGGASSYGSEQNISSGQTPAMMSASSNIAYGPPFEGQWGQPTGRSMSYGHIEGLPAQQYSSQSSPVQQSNYRRVSNYAYPTPIDTTTATIPNAAGGGPSPGPLSAPMVANQQFGYPQGWNPYATQGTGAEVPIQGRSMSGQWYAEPSLLRVDEEAAPPVPYSHAGMSQYYSGP